MSDIGLLGSVYEQIRVFSDEVDHLLVDLKGTDPHVKKQAREQLVTLLERIADKSTKDPSIRLVQSVISQAQTCSTPLDTLAAQLRLNEPDAQQLQHLENIAVTLDHECTETLARMRGKR